MTYSRNVAAPMTQSPFASNHAELARVYFVGRDWNRAAEACRNPWLNPAHVEVRRYSSSLVFDWETHTAPRVFNVLMGSNPSDRDVLLHGSPRSFGPVLTHRRNASCVLGL